MKIFQSDCDGVQAVWGLKFSMAQKNSKSSSWGKSQFEEVPLGKVPVEKVPVGGSVSWGTSASWGKKLT